MEFLYEYGLFLAKSVTVLVVFGGLVSMLAGASQRRKAPSQGHIVITSLNEALDRVTRQLKNAVLSPALLKLDVKAEKKLARARKKTLKQDARQEIAARQTASEPAASEPAASEPAASEPASPGRD